MSQNIQIDLNDYRYQTGYLHFVGCGGVGTGPLMRILHQAGFRVSGSDLRENSITRMLKNDGMRVEIEHRKENLPPEDGSKLLLICTSAAAEDNPELLEAERRGAVILRRGEALGIMQHIFKRVISVSGSHGKTSITAMLAFSLKECGMDPGFLVGGAVCNWPFNGERGSGDLFVTEVDESDGTHACTRSFIGVVPNVEDDHAWSVGGVEQLNRNFKSYAQKAEHLIYMAGSTADQLFADHPDALRLTEKMAVAEFQQFFPESLQHTWGGYQKWNAVLALKVLVKLGIPQIQAVEALSRFPGVERRMTLRCESNSVRVIEDYAHHPTELRAALQALREMNPNRRLLVIFQPHRYARLERYFKEFAAVLAQRADRIQITPVFAAWTQSGKLDSGDLVKAIGPKAFLLDQETWQERAEQIHGEIRHGDVVAVIGAGDSNEIIAPLCALLSKEQIQKIENL